MDVSDYMYTSYIAYGEYDAQYASSYSDYEQHFLYEGYSFERLIYVYIWEILVILTCLINAVVMSVLLRKSMRTGTNMILLAISISDSLTGLVTLPAYIAVFQQFSPAVIAETNFTKEHFSQLNASALPPELIEGLNKSLNQEQTTVAQREGYILSESLCDGFMLSKFFFSKAFHTVSVWLTLFLALQKFLMVYFPLERKSLKMKTVIKICVAVFLFAPCLHVYHLFKDKSLKGYCRWKISHGELCNSDCVYFWLLLLIGQVLPVILLSVFTIYFIHGIWKISKVRDTSSVGASPTSPQNRRLSMLVIAILIVFLIPELPYAGFLLYVVVSAHADWAQNLKFNRAIHASYEIMLVLSFNANFFIYTLLNKQFKQVLNDTIVTQIYQTMHTCIRIVSYALPRRTNSMEPELGQQIEMSEREKNVEETTATKKDRRI